MEKVCGIYKITNTINNQVYIGQSIDIESRWRQHIAETNANKRHTKFYNAMRQFGIEAFQFTILEECQPDIKELNEKEKYWIKYYDSYTNGYNSTHGGQGEDSWFFDPELIHQLWDDGYSTKQISQIVGCSSTTVQERLKGYKDYNTYTSHHRGAIHSPLNKNSNYTFNENQNLFFYHAITVHQYDLIGNYIASYDSLGEAARAIGKNPAVGSAAIGRVIQENSSRAQAYGFQWSKEKVEKLTPVPTSHGKLVRCIETQQIFPSTVAASKWCNLKSKSNIRECCAGIGKTAGRHPITGEKLHWEYVESL